MCFPSLPYRALCVMILPLVLGCQSDGPLLASKTPIPTTVPSLTHVPTNIERLAVLYQYTSDRTLRGTYWRLEAATFRLRELRPSLKIVDRVDLQSAFEEQRFQLGGAVLDETAIGLGRLLGADGVLLYRVEWPSIRDRALARFGGELPPVVVASKIINIETGEVVFLNVVTVPVEKASDEESAFFSVEAGVQAALNQGVDRTITDLQQAFQ